MAQAAQGGDKRARPAALETQVALAAQNDFSAAPCADIFCESDRVIYDKLDELGEKLAVALPEVDSVEGLACGTAEALRTLKEALTLAQSPAWQDWSAGARAFRWHHAGRAELGL